MAAWNRATRRLCGNRNRGRLRDRSLLARVLLAALADNKEPRR